MPFAGNIAHARSQGQLPPSSSALEFVVDTQALTEWDDRFERSQIGHHVLIMLKSIALRHPVALIKATL